MENLSRFSGTAFKQNHTKTIPKPYQNHTKTIPKPYQNFYFLEIPKIPFRRIGFRILTMFQNHCERDRHCSDGPHLIMSRIIVEMVGECFNSEGLLTGEERTLDCAILATLLMALQSVHLGFMLTPGLLENQINWVKKVFKTNPIFHQHQCQTKRLLLERVVKW